MPNLNLFSKLFRNLFTKESLFLVKAILTVGPNPAKFMHDENGPSPSTPRLDTFQKLVFNQHACVRKGKKNTLLGNKR